MGCYYSIDTTYFNKKFSNLKTFVSTPMPSTQITEPYLEAFGK